MVCPKCGAPVLEGAVYCTTCGAELKAQNREIAGFWQRVGGSIIDELLFLPLYFILARMGYGAARSPSYFSLNVVGYLISGVLWFCYRFLLAASPWQGTIGKRLAGLQLTDLRGARLSLQRSAMREVSILAIQLPGLIALFFTTSSAISLLELAGLAVQIVDLAWMSRAPLRQTLHDQMAGTLVYHRVAPLPANIDQYPPALQ